MGLVPSEDQEEYFEEDSSDIESPVKNQDIDQVDVESKNIEI